MADTEKPCAAGVSRSRFELADIIHTPSRTHSPIAADPNAPLISNPQTDPAARDRTDPQMHLDISESETSAPGGFRASDSSPVDTVLSDSLLGRLREKERQFDAKITALDETLFCAARGRAQRDEMIDALRDEIKRLRAQLQEHASCAELDRLLLERNAELCTARAELKRAREQLQERDQRARELETQLRLLSTRNAREPQIRREATNAREPQIRREATNTREPQIRHEARSEQGAPVRPQATNEGESRTERDARSERARYAATLRALRRDVAALERRHSAAAAALRARLDENDGLRARLAGAEERAARAERAAGERAAGAERARRAAGAERAAGERAERAERARREAERAERAEWAERARREAERERERAAGAEAEWAERVRRAAGAARRAAEAERAARLSQARLLRLLAEVPAMRRYLRAGDVEAGEEPFVFTGYVVAPFPRDDGDGAEREAQEKALVAGTGVEDGVYGGTAQLQSYNVFLNGQWCRQLQEIIDDENYFLRRARLRLMDTDGESDGAGMRVPSPNDVLLGRQHDKDFWIPYAVFVEAQKFKDRHCPSARIETFYPFLTALNRVWNERMKQRIVAVTRRLREQQQKKKQAQSVQRDDMRAWGAENCSSHSPFFSSSASALWQQLQSLRREVRRRVTARKSLELFGHYDQLTRCALRQLREVQSEHATLMESQRCRRRIEATRAGIVEDATETMSDAYLLAGKNFAHEKRNGSGGGNEGQWRARSEEMSAGAAARVAAACRDLQQFLSALREQFRLDESAECVPAGKMQRIMDGISDFVEEVQREVSTARVEEREEEEEEEEEDGEYYEMEDADGRGANMSSRFLFAENSDEEEEYEYDMTR